MMRPGDRPSKKLVAVKSAACVAVAALVLVASLTVMSAAEPQSGSTIDRARILDSYANLPLSFVENQGQTDARVLYYSKGPRHSFWLTKDEIVLSFTGDPTMAGGAEPATRGVTLRLRFVGANRKVVLEGQDPATGEVSYFRGNDPARWQTGLPTYTQMVYQELWPGIDLVLRGQAGALKYEFRVQPGGRLEDIRLAYRGADALAVDGSGGLRIGTPLGDLRDSAPVTYQQIGGVRVPVTSRYALNPSAGRRHAYGFTVGADYQRDHELIIDPGLAYSTLIGGASHETGVGIAVDTAGNTYVTGVTQSPDFPTTSGAFDRSGAASNFLDAFVTKLNPTGTALVYSTFLGGGNFEWGRDIEIDAAGNAYVAGQTQSSDFPTTGGAFDPSFNVDSCPRCGIDQYDAFVTKLNPAGSGLVYSTFLGGFDIDDALGIALDSSGAAYVGGETGSSNFPTTPGAFDTSRNGAYDAFITKLNAAGSALVYSTLLGGLEVDFVGDVTVDTAGNVFAMSSTRSADFPTTAGAYDTTINGAFDVALTKLNPAGSALVYSTFLGGSDMDGGGEVAVDSAGNAYVAGGTISPDFPTTPGAFDTTLNDSDAFVTKLNAAGSDLVYSTFIGGSGSEGFGGITLDGDGNAWLAGGTSSPDYPITAGAFDTSFNGVGDAVIVQLNATGSALLDSTFFGGADSDGASDLARDASGNIYITGQTMSPDFPTTAGAFDRIWNGDPLIFWADGFVAKFGEAAPAPPPVPAAPSLFSPANGATPSQPIAFDWSDVANATSYTIQVDDSNPFTSPLVRNQSVADSRFTTTGLASVRHWWRVRAVNSAGAAGAWSAVWSFTPRTPSAGTSLSSLTLNPSTVVGPSSSTGRVALTASAPSGGASVSLASSDTAVATVPATVTIPAGSSSTTFTVTTQGVASSRSVTISAVAGVTRTATLTVTPASTSTLSAPTLLSPASDARFSPGQTIVFDWSDVSGATTYEIQIDDSSTIGSPFVMHRTDLTVSRFETSTLPTRTMWWRVRAIDAAGNRGPWSNVRRFEVKS